MLNKQFPLYSEVLVTPNPKINVNAISIPNMNTITEISLNTITTESEIHILSKQGKRRVIAKEILKNSAIQTALETADCCLGLNLVQFNLLNLLSKPVK